jgi:flagellar hook-associated protein 1 FlgK
MPISSFMGLQTSLRGLLAQQRALDTTGHNISNASTEGYSRQEAVMAAAPALQISAGALQDGRGAQLGTGVDVSEYRRIRDTFLDLQYRAQSMRLGYESTRSEQLSRTEVSLDEPGDHGINTQLERFWNAWADLSNAPADAAARTALVEQAATLADAFGTVDDQLTLVGAQAQAEYDAITGQGGELQVITDEIAQLNQTIKSFVTAGDIPNDLMDRRDLLLDQMSELGQVTTVDLGNGSIDVLFGDPAANPIALVDDVAVNWPPTLIDTGGKLQALQETANAVVPSYRDALDGVARKLADAVNGVHPGFFAYAAGAEAGTLAVAVTPAGVQAGSGGAPGANDVALRVTALRGGAADSDYRAFIARVGTDVRGALRQEANARSLTDAVQDRRQSVAGVSLDEEMSNLVRFQRAYQASSRAMSTMDEMLDVLINRTGRVGL